MLKCAGIPVPILKPFKAVFTYDISTQSQPSDKAMGLCIVDEDIIIESTGNKIFVNDTAFAEWTEKASSEFTNRTMAKILKTMVISAVYGEDRYLKLLKEETSEK